MSRFAALLAEDRRLIILRALAEDHDYALNDFVLKRALASLGHEVSRDMLRGDLTWLKDQRLITLRELDDGGIWVARATEDGIDVAGGRPHPGVARPAPGL
ncbi:MAG: ArsR family transcriptional regulator [Acetobacteraceae bacterium]